MLSLPEFVGVDMRATQRAGACSASTVPGADHKGLCLPECSVLVCDFEREVEDVFLRVEGEVIKLMHSER